MCVPRVSHNNNGGAPPRGEEEDMVPTRIELARKLAEARVDERDVEGLAEVARHVADCHRPVDVEHDHRAVHVPQE